MGNAVAFIVLKIGRSTSKILPIGRNATGTSRKTGNTE